MHNMKTCFFFDTEFPKRSPERLGQIQGLEGCDQIKWLVGKIPWETSTKKKGIGKKSHKEKSDLMVIRECHTPGFSLLKSEGCLLFVPLYYIFR